MPKTFRAAIVGAGHISPFHVAGIQSCPNVDLVAICDVDKARAVNLARQHDIPHTFGTIDELQELGVNVIHVATPPASHFPLTMKALDLNCHVFVEKPLATSIEHCETIERAAVERNLRVGVNHSNLADPFVAEALRQVRAGRIGDVLSACYLRSSNYPDYIGGPLPIHYRDGGYPFRDIGVHALYTLREILGDINDVHASFAHRGSDANLMFDEWSARMSCENGDGLVQLSWNARPLQNALIIQGTHGVIRCEPFSMFVSTRRSGRLPKLIERVLNSVKESAQIGFQVPWNMLRFAAGRLKQYHGVQETIQMFYRELPERVPVGLSIHEATPIVRWTEEVSRAADEEKLRRMARIAAPEQADVLVTGAAGFIGRRLVDRLLKSRQRVRILVRNGPLQEFVDDPQVEVVVGDLGDPEVVIRAVRNVPLVYHLGAAMKGSRPDFQRGTEVGTKNVVDAILQNDNCRMVYVSSLSVLHASLATPNDIVTEDWPLEPYPERRGNYTFFKLRAEQIVSRSAQRDGLQAVIIRPGQVFGPNATLLTPAVARQAGSRLIVLGNGSVPLPLVYVEDLVDALLAAADRGPYDGTIIQIVDDTLAIDQNELLRRILAGNTGSVTRVPRPIVYSLAMGVQLAFKILRRSAPLNLYRVRSGLSHWRFRSDRARELLDWSPSIGVERGLEKCLSATNAECPRSERRRRATAVAEIPV